VVCVEHKTAAQGIAVRDGDVVEAAIVAAGAPDESALRTMRSGEARGLSDRQTFPPLSKVANSALAAASFSASRRQKRR